MRGPPAILLWPRPSKRQNVWRRLPARKRLTQSQTIGGLGGRLPQGSFGINTSANVVESHQPNNPLQPRTPAPHRTPALAGGARGCGESTRTPAQTAHLPSRRTSGRCGGRCLGVLGLRLTRRACGRSKASCPPECARMCRLLPEPPGSCPSQARGPTWMLPEQRWDDVRDVARIPSADATRSSRPLGGRWVTHAIGVASPRRLARARLPAIQVILDGVRLAAAGLASVSNGYERPRLVRAILP